MSKFLFMVLDPAKVIGFGVVENNNDLLSIQAMSYQRNGLTPEESEAITQEQQDSGLIRVTPTFQTFVNRKETISPEIRPVLKRFSRGGPFSLDISNQGISLDKSMLVFEIAKTTEQKSDGGVFLDNEELVSKSIASIPFLDVFRADVEREAERAEKLIRKSKVINFDTVRAERDQDLVNLIINSFAEATSSPKPDKAARKVGKEAICDSLDTSFALVSTQYYDTVWYQMQEFFEPAIRYLGEQCALGKASLDSPALIRT